MSECEAMVEDSEKQRNENVEKNRSGLNSDSGDGNGNEPRFSPVFFFSLAIFSSFHYVLFRSLCVYVFVGARTNRRSDLFADNFAMELTRNVCKAKPK